MKRLEVAVWQNGALHSSRSFWTGRVCDAFFSIALFSRRSLVVHSAFMYKKKQEREKLVSLILLRWPLYSWSRVKRAHLLGLSFFFKILTCFTDQWESHCNGETRGLNWTPSYSWCRWSLYSSTCVKGSSSRGLIVFSRYSLVSLKSEKWETEGSNWTPSLSLCRWSLCS